MFWQKEAFLFSGLSPPNRKMKSLRPRRLCGEISILEKSEEIKTCSHGSTVPPPLGGFGLDKTVKWSPDVGIVFFYLRLVGG